MTAGPERRYKRSYQRTAHTILAVAALDGFQIDLACGSE
jgi:hypothetical protein